MNHPSDLRFFLRYAGLNREVGMKFCFPGKTPVLDGSGVGRTVVDNT